MTTPLQALNSLQCDDAWCDDCQRGVNENRGLECVDCVELAMKAVAAAAYAEAIKRAASFLDEVARRSMGRAAEPINLSWVAERLRAMAETGEKSYAFPEDLY